MINGSHGLSKGGTKKKSFGEGWLEDAGGLNRTYDTEVEQGDEKTIDVRDADQPQFQ